MSELVTAYDIHNLDAPIPLDRKEFYEGQVKVFNEIGMPTYAVAVVNLFMFNTSGELILQKRSFDKSHNPGLLDKSVGGHIKYGDSPEYTVMVETVQELQTPSIVLRSAEDFEKTYELLHDYLETVAIIQHIDTKFFAPKKIIQDKVVNIGNLIHFYFGVYNGRIRPVDREAKGVLFYSLSELQKEMTQLPQMFTDDLHIFVKTYKDQLEAFVEQIKK